MSFVAGMATGVVLTSAFVAYVCYRLYGVR